MIQDTAIAEHLYELVCDLCNMNIFSDLEWLLTHAISRLDGISTLNIEKQYMIYRHCYTGMLSQTLTLALLNTVADPWGVVSEEFFGNQFSQSSYSRVS